MFIVLTVLALTVVSAVARRITRREIVEYLPGELRIKPLYIKGKREKYESWRPQTRLRIDSIVWPVQHKLFLTSITVGSTHYLTSYLNQEQCRQFLKQRVVLVPPNTRVHLEFLDEALEPDPLIAIAIKYHEV